jgi:hypothetical protein
MRPNWILLALSLRRRRPPDPVTTTPEPINKVSAPSQITWPSFVYWLIPAGVALLGWLPKLWQIIVPPPKGSEYLGIAHLPMDFLVYEAFVRQAATNGSILLSNPFTTEPQSPRFILLFHWLLGQFSAITHLSPNAVLEIARIGLVFVFFGVLWWFLAPVLKDPRDRRCAALLIGFAGGFESWIHQLYPSISERIEGANRFAQETWVAFGWNFFGSSLNPLWLAGIIGSLIVLRYSLAENGLASWGEKWIVGVTIFLLYWIHPYSALGTLAIVGMRFCVEWFVRGQLNVSALIKPISTFILPLAAIAVLVSWQLRDPIYRASTGGFYGDHDLSIFWYPITLGAVGLMALCGARAWANQRHPYLPSVAAWIIAIVFLHSSPLINGYHFVYLLPIPLCILAAGPVRAVFKHSGMPAIVLALALFAAPAFTLLGLFKEAENVSFPTDTTRVIAALDNLPAGNVMSHPQLGNIIPARTDHRVWVGHWFLTPAFYRRFDDYRAMTTEPERLPQLLKELNENQIRYLIVPTENAKPLQQRLGARVENLSPQGAWLLFTLQLGAEK